MSRFEVYCILMMIILFLLLNASSGDSYERPIDRTKFNFLDQSEKRLYEDIHEQILAKVKGAAWRHDPLGKVGSSLVETWYQGHNPSSIISSWFMSQPGNRWYELATFHYRLPHVFGVNFLAGFNPEKDGWGVRFYYAKGGKKLLGDSCSLDFPFFRDGRESFKISFIKYYVTLPSNYILSNSYRSRQFLLKTGNTHLEELQLLINSPDSLKKRGIKQYSELKKQLHQNILDHKIRKIVFGKYKGGGIPPENWPVDLTPQEEDKLSEWVDSEIKKTIDSIKLYYRVFYGNLIDLFPFENMLKRSHVVELLDFLDRLHGIRPFTRTATAGLLGVSWSKEPAGPFGPGPLDVYHGTVTKSVRGFPGLISAELRLPARSSAAADGMLILKFDSRRLDVPFRKLRKSMGGSGEPVFLHPNQPQDSPVAVCYPGRDEELRFLYGHTYKDLVGLVVDRISPITEKGAAHPEDSKT